MFDLPNQIPNMDLVVLKIEEIYSNDHDECLEAIKRIKNNVIGNDRLKGAVLETGVADRLVELMKLKNGDVAREAMIVVASLARGTEHHIRMLIDANAVPTLLINTQSDIERFVEPAFRCLRTIYLSKLAPIEMIFSSNVFGTRSSHSVLNHFIELAMDSKTLFVIKECILTILGECCRTTEHQTIMKEHGALTLVTQVLHDSFNPYQLRIAALTLLSQLCYENEEISNIVVNECKSSTGRSLISVLYELMSKSNQSEMQLMAAKCMTYIYRSNALSSDDGRILYRTLPTLINFCKKEYSPALRSQAGSVLAHLTQMDVSLQQTASICDQLIYSLSDMLRQSSILRQAAQQNAQQNSATQPSKDSPKLMEQDISNGSFMCQDDSMSDSENDSEYATQNNIREAAFRVFGSLASNDEHIRMKVIKTEYLMDELMAALEDSNTKVKVAALYCLQSLSRSVYQLRTSFHDYAFWVPLRNMLQNSKDEVLSLALSCLCNLLIEFSPSKQHFVDRRAIELLCDFTRRENLNIRRNGVWALMNMAFQVEESIKIQILNFLGTEQIFKLLSDSDMQILMKTLGLLRNLLANKPHTDRIMNQHGKQIMQAIILILEEGHSNEVKEQALCILSNIAAGDSAKEFIMTNDDILHKLLSYLGNSNVNLQLAAVDCITNLAYHKDEGAIGRQERLKEFSMPNTLQKMLQCNNATVSSKARFALNQFGINSSLVK